MSGFVAHIPPQALADEQIGNEAFFPAISTAHMRAIGRFDGAITPDVLRAAIVAALIHVNDQLRTWALASRPTRARGLKQVVRAALVALVASRPSRARGLKRCRADAARQAAGRALQVRVD